MDENDILNVDNSSDSLIDIPSYLGTTTYSVSRAHDHCTGSDNCPHDWEDCGQVSPCQTTAECSQWTPCSSNAQCSQSTPTKPGNATSLTITDIEYEQVSIVLGAVTNADYYTVAYHVSGSSDTTYIDVHSTGVTISGLENGTTYVINYRGVNSAGVGSFLSTGVTFTTKSVPATIDVISVGSDSITVRLTGLQTAYAYNDRKCQWYIDGVAKATIPFSAGVSSAATYTFTGLSPETTYEIMAVITGDAGGGFTKILYETATTTSSGSIYISDGSIWNKYTPYIFTTSGWQKAIPYIYTNSGWTKTI